jgi:uracil-DNA glycosylase
MNFNEKEKLLIDRFGTWYEPLKDYLHSDEFWEILNVIGTKRKQGRNIFPKVENYFKAFLMCPFSCLKVVVLGESPLTNGLSNGLYLGQLDTIYATVPPIIEELENVYNTLIIDYDYTFESWAKQGILLLNCPLTVERIEKEFYENLWKPFILEVLKAVNKEKICITFVITENTKPFIPNIDKECNFIINKKTGFTKIIDEVLYEVSVGAEEPHEKYQIIWTKRL